MKNVFRMMVVFIAASFIASTAYGLGIEEFDNGSGGWDISPRKKPNVYPWLGHC